MLATATFFFGAVLAGSDVQDRIGSLEMDKVETRRRANTWGFTTLDSALFVGTSACELGDFDGLPSLKTLEDYHDRTGAIYEAHRFETWINGMEEQCRPCLQTCLDGLAVNDLLLGYQWVHTSTKPDRAMVSCSLRCAERTAAPVCDTADYLEVPVHMNGWTADYMQIHGVTAFVDSSPSPPCKKCLNRCTPILAPLDFDHLEDLVEARLGKNTEDVDSEDLEDLSAHDKAAIASSFLALDQGLREWHSCISCCSGFEMDTYYGAFPEGETCATAEFGTTDHHKSTKIKVETKYDVFGVIMTETQFYITLAVVGALLLCLICSCCYCCCIYCCCCRKSDEGETRRTEDAVHL